MEESDVDPPLIPPAPGRVSLRALVLAATTCRAFIEADSESESLRKEVLQWVHDVGATSELEPYELVLLSTPIGSLPRQAVIDASWRSEGLLVLAWALGLRELLAHDEAVDPQDISNCVGLLDPEPPALTSGRLQSEAALLYCSELHFALHWRLLEYQLTHKSMNFAELARTAWFGPLTIDGLRLCEGDLAVGALPISAAPDPAFQRCLSIAIERQKAINWVRGYAELYSETPTDT